MEAKIKGIDNAGYWVIPEDGRYRVVVDFETRTVTIGLASNFIEADKIYIAGTCVSADVEMTRTIEDENQYAFHAELQPRYYFISRSCLMDRKIWLLLRKNQAILQMVQQ